MVGSARVAPPFTRGVDALMPFTRDQLLSFKERYGVTVVGAYVEILASKPEYRDLIFDLDLGIAPYSEAAVGNVDAAAGEARGVTAARLLASIGGPTGLDLLIDAEACIGDVVGYINARAQAYEREAGYGSLLYVGEPLPAGITPQVLQALRPSRYMRSCSLGVPEPVARKWCVLQHNPGNYLDPVLQVRVDHFTVEQDALGGLPTWWWPQ